MARLAQYVRILSHTIYLILLSYFITQRSFTTVHLKRIDRFNVDLKHILMWSKFNKLEGEGQTYFIKEKCKFRNCYLTSNKSLFSDVRYFDVLIFNVQDISEDSNALPIVRGANQKYIMAANDSADNYPVCNPLYDAYFNWTWTYRSDSFISYKFISVFNKLHEELGSHFVWNRNMKPIDIQFQNQFALKSKAATIFLDICLTKSKRENFIVNLQSHLSKYNLSVDIFGKCGSMQCKKRSMNPCLWKLRKQYFFYLALEDSFAYDYITNVVLYGYQNNAVPVVYGGADYEKFLPPGSYLNGVKLGAKALATTMYEIMNDKKRYYDFFRWKNHYTIRDSPVLNGCALCEKLNNPLWLTIRTNHRTFRKWWNPTFDEQCYGNSRMVVYKR